MTRYKTQQITIFEQTKHKKKKKKKEEKDVYVNLTLRSSRSLSPPCTVSSYICTVSSYISKTKQLYQHEEFNGNDFLRIINKSIDTDNPSNESTLLR